jgi:hypothetical protein
MRPRVRLRDYSRVEHFVLDYARYPELPGVRSRWTIVRGRTVLLATRVRTARSPWEAGSAAAWRRRTAATTLFGIARLSDATRHAAQLAASKVTR